MYMCAFVCDSAMSAFSFTVMYEDESIDARVTDGSRVRLSSCGSEFVVENARPRERVRQRTRFTTSKYKTLLMEALNFRNKYATHPYLPEELIPDEQKQKIFTDLSEMEWSASDTWSISSSSDGVIVSSVDRRAKLMLSGSGEEFTVEFLCRSSQNEKRATNTQHTSSQPENRPPSLPEGHHYVSLPRTELGRTYVHTLMVQHHSCLLPPDAWHTPLVLAQSRWKTNKNGREKEGEEGHVFMSTSAAAVRTHMPIALPLTCSSPHLHRWHNESVATDWPELDTPTELVKVVWCHGVLYRMIGGSVPVVEVSPGDGSIIRSNGVLADYFTHYRPGAALGTTLEMVYYLNQLPPDRPGQLYSVRSVVTRASRILQCYRQASSSRLNRSSLCCWRRDGAGTELCREGLEFSQLTLPHDQRHEIQVDGGRAYHRSVLAELEKIKRFNFLLENTPVPKSLTGSAQTPNFTPDPSDPVITESSVSEALQKTSKAIQDINTLLSQNM